MPGAADRPIGCRQPRPRQIQALQAAGGPLMAPAPSHPHLLSQATFTGLKANNTLLAKQEADFHGRVARSTSVVRRWSGGADAILPAVQPGAPRAPQGPRCARAAQLWAQKARMRLARRAAALPPPARVDARPLTPPCARPRPAPRPPPQARAGTKQVTVSAKKIRVAINGFGRIGRQFLRCWEGRTNSNLEVRRRRWEPGSTGVGAVTRGAGTRSAARRPCSRAADAGQAAVPQPARLPGLTPPPPPAPTHPPQRRWCA